jgi:hypothetical protein
VKVLLLLGLLAAIGLGPFVWLKRPWALRFWGRVKLFIVVYIFVIVVAAILRLAFGWGDIYG